ncbi:KEOPS complex subunit Pcc1 [Methanothermobacter thermautotrophicus]|uniref:Transcription factor Pcc1 n=1 Tax=Methanothermobacter thermautotrophicus TaxID=145262 RepID=A0A7J4MUY8_METTF|nr:hypothetical protein [Methanothermobacter sp.]HIH64549.1 hypothetical protein [Methanothermobacter thermautotrophicus]
MSELGLRRIQGVIDIMTDPESASVIYRAIKPEVMDSPSQRSSMSMELDDGRITIVISAGDSASFRAALNSSLRWVKLSMEILELMGST